MPHRARARSTSSRQYRLDQELIDRLCAGDTLAFGDLWQYHEEWILRFFTRKTGSAQEAEDLLSECRLAVFRSLPSFVGRPADSSHPPCTLRTFLGAIAKRLFADWLRRKYKQKQVCFSDVPLWNQLVEEGRIAPDDVFGGSDEIETSAIDRVRSAVADLQSEHQFKAVVFHYFGGLSHDAIADLLGTRGSCVNTRLQDARRALKRSLSNGVDPKGHADA